jgi:Helix-turn-helix domain of resolvase
LSDHTDTVRTAILRAVPLDGSSLSNQKLIKAVAQISDASEKSIRAVLDALIDEGVLAKGKGRGGSVYIATSSDEDDDALVGGMGPDGTLNEISPEEDTDDDDDTDEDDTDDFELTVQVGDGPPRTHRKSTKKSKGSKSESKEAEGIAKAKAAGVYKGRRPSIDAAKVRDLKKKGLGASEIAKALKIGRASVYRALEA